MRINSQWKTVLTAAALVAALGGSAGALAGQGTGSIRGRVVEGATQRPIVGAQVVVEGTGRGGLTNVDGAYMVLNVPSGTRSVAVHMIGYSRVVGEIEVVAGETAELSFELSQSAIQLDGLVVTGTPGATQKRALGNTVSTIAAEELNEVAPTTTVTQMLQGRTPGLTVMMPSGQVGVAANFRIRGASSLYGGIQPVFYVDGVRVNSSAQGGYGTGSNTVRETSALDNLNPEDIESIEVIKGPAAATLYGADAAGGVIQIITKKGKAGQQSVQWTGRVELGQSDWAAPMKTNYALCTESRIADAAGWPGCQGLDPSAPWEDRLLTEQPLKQDGVLRDGGLQRYHLSARGGGERYSYYLSGDREEEEGVFANNYFDRTSARANFTILPYENLDLTFTAQYSTSASRQPNNDNSSNGWLRNAYRGIPGAASPWAPGWRGLGPEQISMYDNTIDNERFILGFTADHKLGSWLRNRLTLGMDAGERTNTLFYPIDRTGRAPFGASYENGYIGLYMPATRDYTVDYSGTIDSGLPFLGDAFTSAFSFGMQYAAESFHSTEVIGDGLAADLLRLISDATDTRAYEDREEQRSLGFFVQEQVGWRNRLFVTGGLRIDDHSTFGKDFETIVYPKVAASWVVSEEDFFDLDFVNDLRLRASYGQAGNAPEPFAADRTYGAATVILADGSLAPALSPESYGNPELHAERGEEYELGFDASLFEEKLGAELTYYSSTTRDALILVPVAPSTGFTGSVYDNIGEIYNRGVELSLFGTPMQTPTFTWDVRVGFSTNHNELISLGGSRDYIPVGYRSTQRHQEGFPLAGYWAEEIQYNADGSVMLDTRGRPVFGDSMVYVGPSVPTREASLTNTFTVLQNLTLYTFMDYKGGHYLFNMGEQTAVRDGNARIANDPTVTDEEWAVARYGDNMPFLEKADFVKLREVSLKYTLPREWVGLFRAEAMSVNLSARNLATWTDYSGSDPEVNIGGTSNSTRADYMSVPAMRQFVVSVDFNF